MFAEWTLTPGEMEAERQRVVAMLTRCKAEDEQWQLTEVQHGDYACIVLYQGEHPFRDVPCYYMRTAMFAWNEETGRVRYIFVYSSFPTLENWAPDTLYYLTLDWGTEEASEA